MGFEKLISFLNRNLGNNCIEEMSINNSVRKVLANHVFFDLNFLVYYCVVELDEEINKILKIICSLNYNNNVNFDERINNILELEHWKKSKVDFSEILDGDGEVEIIKSFIKYLESNCINKYPIVFKILYWKIHFRLIKWIENFHDFRYLKSINIFFDGIPSFSKILEQRRRRTKNYLESKIRKKTFNENFNNILNDLVLEDGLYFNYFNWLNNKYNINKSIGPTSDLNLNLEIFLKSKLTQKYNLEVNLINGQSYGESDNKIFCYIYKYELGDDIVIHTCDSDLVHQTLVQQTYFYLNNKQIDLSVIRYYTKDYQGSQYVSAKKIIKLIVKKYLEMSNIKKEDKTNYYLIFDLMFIIYFFGNDNLPSSVEMGSEISLNYLIISHVRSLRKGNYAIMTDKDNNFELKLDNFRLWLLEILKLDTFTIIVLNRYYKLPYNVINFLVESLNLRAETFFSDFLLPFYIYEGYQSEKNNIILEDEDLRKKYYLDYRKRNKNGVPKNIFDLTLIPDNLKKKYISIRETLLKFLDFFEEENFGLQLNNKIQMLVNSSYQDMYNYIYKKSELISMNNYKNFYKPYNYFIKDLKKIRKQFVKDDEKIDSYLMNLYYHVKVYFNNMKNYNPCNFVCYEYFDVPRLHHINLYIENNLTNKLYEKWNKKIDSLQATNDRYFNSLSHHIFITPYLRNSDYLDKIDNIPNLKKILDELNNVEGGLWFKDNENKEFNYRRINPVKFLENWSHVMNKINLENLKNNDLFLMKYDEKNI